MLSWQNILNSRHIATDIEEKYANQGEVIREGISRIYLSLSNENHATKPSTVGHVILGTALERYFRFHWNCKQLRVEARNSMPNCEIYFFNFLKLYIQIWKYFHSMVLGRVGRGCCNKNRVLEFLVKTFV